MALSKRIAISFSCIIDSYTYLFTDALLLCIKDEYGPENIHHSLK